MAFNDLFYVVSLIIIGGTIGHVALLSLARHISQHNVSVSLWSLRGLKAFRGAEHEFSSVIEIPKRPSAAEPRGLLANIPERQAVVDKSWSDYDRRNAVHNLMVAAQKRNHRSTYLGARTFDKLNPSAQLFGWHRVPGKATVELGEIAQAANEGDEVALHLLLQPEDAHKVLSAGWGKEVKTSAWKTHGGRQRETKGVQVLLTAPRNPREVAEVTDKVLEAAVWFVAGLDRAEDV